MQLRYFIWKGLGHGLSNGEYFTWLGVSFGGSGTKLEGHRNIMRTIFLPTTWDNGSLGFISVYFGERLLPCMFQAGPAKKNNRKTIELVIWVIAVPCIQKNQNTGKEVKYYKLNGLEIQSQNTGKFLYPWWDSEKKQKTIIEIVIWSHCSYHS